MKKNIVAAFSLSLLASTAALAGEKTTKPVSVSFSSKAASGSLGSARNSADDVQLIGCSSFAQVGKSPVAWCLAIDEKLQTVQCQTKDPGLIGVIGTLSGDSDVQFGWDEAFDCTYVYVTNLSSYEPKK